MNFICKFRIAKFVDFYYRIFQILSNFFIKYRTFGKKGVQGAAAINGRIGKRKEAEDGATANRISVPVISEFARMN